MKSNHYWVLYREKQDELMTCGEIAYKPPRPEDLHQKSNEFLLEIALNQTDSFDCEMRFEEEDKIVLHFNAYLPENERVSYAFVYRSSRWFPTPVNKHNPFAHFYVQSGKVEATTENS